MTLAICPHWIRLATSPRQATRWKVVREESVADQDLPTFKCQLRTTGIAWEGRLEPRKTLGSWGDLPARPRSGGVPVPTPPRHGRDGWFVPRPVSHGLVSYSKVTLLAEITSFLKTGVFCRNVAAPPLQAVFWLFLLRQLFPSMTRQVIFFNQGWNERSRSIPTSSSSVEICFLRNFKMFLKQVCKRGHPPGSPGGQHLRTSSTRASTRCRKPLHLQIFL